MKAKEEDMKILCEYSKREYAPIILLDRLVKSVQEKYNELYKNESGAEKMRLTARKHGGMIKLNYKKLHAIYAGRRDKIWVEGEPALPAFN